MITLTQSAAAKVKQLLETNTRQGDALRVRVTAGGCSGLRYELAFDSQAADSDEEIEQRGVRLVVDAKTALVKDDVEGLLAHEGAKGAVRYFGSRVVHVKFHIFRD